MIKYKCGSLAAFVLQHVPNSGSICITHTVLVDKLKNFMLEMPTRISCKGTGGKRLNII
jgi:hypothetical protein